MRLLIKVLVVLALAAGLGLLIRYHEGSVLVSLPPDEYRLQPNELALAILFMFGLGYVLLRVLIQLFMLPETLSGWLGARRHRKAERALHEAVMAMHEGDLERVDQLAELAQRDEATAGPAALMAARAAHMKGDAVRRNEWLQRSTSAPNAERARIMLAAEAALDDERPLDALAVLSRAAAAQAGGVPMLRLRLRALQQAGQWREALQVGTQLHRAKGLGGDALERLRARALEALFDDAQDPAAVEAVYQEMGAERQAPDAVVEAAAEAYARVGEEVKALRVIERILERRVSARALVAFTRLDTIPPRDRLRLAERWLSQHADDPLILATLGRLCIAEGLWGKAEEFLRAANEKSPSPFTRLALAEMYEAMGRQHDASVLYKDIARDQRPGLLPPVMTEPRLPG